MYSPKIKNDLIPRIYRVAKARRVRMTTLVNEILEDALIGSEESGVRVRKNSREEENHEATRID